MGDRDLASKRIPSHHHSLVVRVGYVFRSASALFHKCIQSHGGVRMNAVPLHLSGIRSLGHQLAKIGQFGSLFCMTRSDLKH